MYPSKNNNTAFLVLGRAGLDLYADPPGTHLENAMQFSSALGGSAANIAAGIARLGGETSLISVISQDAVGRFIINQLQRYKIAADYITIVSSEVRSSLAIVETRNEDCQSVIYRNGASDFLLSTEQVRSVNFAKFGNLIVTGTSLAVEPSRSATFLAMDLAHKVGLTVIFDVDYRPYSWVSATDAAATYSQAAMLSDIVIGNDVEFAVMAGGDGRNFAKALSQQHHKIAIYKMGERGSITYGDEKIFTTEIFSVKALKPTGAGDAFMAAFVMGLQSKLELQTCVLRGSAAAAIVVTKVGCAPAMPTYDELNTFINNHEKGYT